MNSSNIINTTFSVCSRKDISTWAISSKFILKNIMSNNYVVIVPDDDIFLFMLNSPNQFKVIGESHFIGNLKSKIKKMIPLSNQNRIGWYLQQFIKLSFLAKMTDDDVYLIWDADTVPIKQLNFFDPKGNIIFYKGNEFHNDYFYQIERLLGLDKIVNYSFISQCFPIRGLWMKEFLNEIEKRHHEHWLDALINSIDFTKPSGFSEYEILGTFISHRYPTKFVVSNHSWLRGGNGLIGYSTNINWLTRFFILKRYDYVSFELWDLPFSKLKNDFKVLSYLPIKLFKKIFYLFFK